MYYRFYALIVRLCNTTSFINAVWRSVRKGLEFLRRPQKRGGCGVEIVVSGISLC